MSILNPMVSGLPITLLWLGAVGCTLGAIFSKGGK